MVAPVDAKAALTVGEGDAAETFTLAMNFRTFALAKAGGVDMFASDAGRNMGPFELAVLVKAFATPAHPSMTEEEAFAIAMRHGEQLGETIKQMSEDFGAQIGKPKAGARPTPTQRTKRK